jgi:hypothetical protein
MTKNSIKSWSQCTKAAMVPALRARWSSASASSARSSRRRAAPSLSFPPDGLGIVLRRRAVDLAEHARVQGRQLPLQLPDQLLLKCVKIPGALEA